MTVVYDYDFKDKNDEQEYGFCRDIVLDLCQTVPGFVHISIFVLQQFVYR